MIKMTQQNTRFITELNFIRKDMPNLNFKQIQDMCNNEGDGRTNEINRILQLDSRDWAPWYELHEHNKSFMIMAIIANIDLNIAGAKFYRKPRLSKPEFNNFEISEIRKILASYDENSDKKLQKYLPKTYQKLWPKPNNINLNVKRELVTDIFNDLFEL